jgi:hypothetical protein
MKTLGAGFLALMMAVALPADTIRLKNGRAIQGTVVGETSTNISIEVEKAGGTILTTETYPRDEIAEVVFPTSAQKAQEELQRAYQAALKYRLDPDNSQPLSAYDQAINSVFTPFLKQYPGSPYEEEIKNRLADWSAERDKVAAGYAKVSGQWLPPAAAGKRLENVRAQALLERGRRLASRNQFSAALDEFRKVQSITHREEWIGQARSAHADALRLWVGMLQRQRDGLNLELKTYEERSTRLLARSNEAEQRMQRAEQEAKSGDTRRLGADAVAGRLRSEFLQTREQYVEAESHLFDVRQRINSLEQQLAEVKAIPPFAGAPAPPAVVSAPPPPVPAPVAEPGTPEILTRVGGLLSRYWAFGLLAVVLIAWGCVRLFSK